MFPHFEYCGYATGSFKSNGPTVSQTVGQTVEYYAGTRYLYFERDKYNIEFYEDLNTVKSTVPVYYEGTPDSASIPSLSDQGHRRFVGWSYTEGDTNPDNAIDFTTFEMPDYTVRVYPIWVTDAINVQLNLGATDATISDNQSKSFWPTNGSTIDMTYMNDATRPDYLLDGWYTSKNELFREGTGVTYDMCDGDPTYDSEYHNYVYTLTLTAKWTPYTQAKIGYELSGGTGSISDPAIYLLNGDVKVSETSPTAPANKVFIGWQDRLGIIHLPGDTFTFDTNELVETVDGQNTIVLTAIYSNQGAPTATITYNANYPSGATGTGAATATEGSLAFNARTTLKGVDAFSCNGYVLDGWGNTPGAKDYDLNANVVVDDVVNGTNDNTLYGHWTTHTHDWTYTDSSTNWDPIKATCNAPGHAGANPIELSLNKNKVAYDGQPHGVTFTGLDEFNEATGHSVSAADIVYYKQKDQHTALEGAPTDAGTYIATVTVEGKTTKCELTITPKGLPLSAADISVAPTSFDYNGAKQVPTVTITDRDFDNYQLVEGTDFVVKYYPVVNGTPDTSNPVAEPTDAGTYQIELIGKGNYTNSLRSYTFTINKVDPTYSVTPTNPTYNGQEQPLVNVTCEGGTLEIGRPYDNESFSPDVPKETAAGDYELWYVIKGDKNHNDVGDTVYHDSKKVKKVTSTISPKPVTITAAQANFSKVVNTEDPELKITLTTADGIIEGDTVNVTLTRATGETVGDYTYTKVECDNPNYKVTLADDAKFTITSHEHEWTYEGTTAYDARNVATITATCGNTDGGHEGDLSVVLTLSASNVEYDFNPHPFTLKGLDEFNAATGLSVSANDIVYSKLNGYTYEQISGVPIESGTYMASITVGGATAELRRIYVSGRQIANCTSTVEDASYTYDGNSHVPGTTVVDWRLDDYKLVKGQDYTVEIRKVGESGDFDSWEIVTAPTVAGTYQVRINGIGNWVGSTTSIYAPFRFTIEKAESPVKPDGTGLKDTDKPTGNTGLVYSGNPQALVTAPTTKPEGVDHVEYSIDGGNTWTTELPTGTKAGDYTVTVKYVGDANHKDVVLDQTIPVTIAKADITPTVTIKGWTYGEKANEPSVTGNSGNGTVTYEYKLASAEDTAYSAAVPTAAGDYTVRATVAETANYNGGTDTANFTIAAKTVDTDGTTTDPSDDLTVEGVTTSFTYDGDNHMPKPSTVKVGEIPLTEGTDYDVTYKGKNGETYTDVTEAKKAGDYQAVITLKGNYSGTKTINYTIAPKSLTASGIEAALSAEELTYTGSKLVPTASVKDGTSDLTDGADFTVSYKDAQGNPVAEPTNAGTYTVIITGTGNYKDSIEKTFTIKPAKASESDFNDVLPTPNKGADGKDLSYTGQPQELVTAPTVALPTGYTGIQYGTKGEDGNITWSDEIPTGTDVDSYDVYVKYVGDKNHEDVEITKPVTVAIAKVDPAVTAPTDAKKTYTGQSQTIVNAATTNDGTVQYSLSKDGPWSTDLPKATNEGTYNVYYKVVGDKNHNDSEVLGPVTATILAAEVTSDDITASGIDDSVTYDGTAKKPTPSSVTVPDPSDPTKTVELGEGDYDVTYYKAEDINADGTIKEGAQPIAEPTDAGDYQAVITLTGNYSGSTTVPFTIEPASLTGAAMSLSPASGTYTGSAQEPTPSITLEGVTPNTVPTDSCTITYQKKNAETGEWENFTGKPTGAGEYKVIATGKPDSNFKDSVEQTFTIAKANPTVTDPTAKTGLSYTGEEQNLINPATTSDGTVYYSTGKNGPWTTTPPKATDQGDYDVYWYVEGDANHNDSGSKTEPKGPVTTTIAAKTVDTDGTSTPDASDDLTVTGVENEYTYNGSDQKPEPVVKVGNTTLTEGKDYDVKYYDDGGNEVTNTTDAGAYKVVIEFKGNYSGSKEISYDISRAKLADASDVTISPESPQVYNGSEMSPVPTVKLNSTTTVPADDYDVKYYKASDFDDTTGQPKSGATPVTPKEAGDYRVFISAKDGSTNYQGSTVVPFTISAKETSADNITITFDNDEPLYDGTPQKPAVTVTVPDPADPTKTVTLEEGKDFEVTWPDDTTNAGEKTPTITLKGDWSGSNTASYEVQKRTLTLTGETDTKTFNNDDQELTGITVTGDGLVSGHTHTAKYSAKGKAVGEHPGTITAADRVVIKDASGAVVTDNYNITTTAGTLTITAKTIYASDVKVTFADAEPTYDGKEQKPKATITVPDPAYPDDPTKTVTLVEGKDFEITYPADTTNVGEKKPVITLKGDYSGTKSDASYEVKPASLSAATVTLNPTSPQTFNNQDQPNTPTVVLNALNSTDKTVPVSSYNVTYQMKNPETGKYEAVDVPKAAGDYRVVITAKETADNNFKDSVTADFTIEPTAIDANDIQVTFAQDEITYSGNENKPTVTVKVPNPANPSETITLEEGKDFEVTWPDDTTNVGEKTPKITLIGSYSGEREADTYKVTPATLTVTTQSDTKTYDGNALTAGGTITGFVTPEGGAQETATFTVTGSATNVADSGTNTYTITWDGTAKKDNYTISENLGTLTVNKAIVTLVSASFEREYNGNVLNNSETASVKDFNEATQIPTGSTKVDVIGTFGFAPGEGATITFTGRQKVVNISENKFTYTLKDGTDANNYTVQPLQFGTLNVMSRDAKYEISVVANSDTVTYDGQKHSVSGVQLDRDNTEQYKFTVDGNTYTVSGLSTQDPTDKTEAGTYPNNITGTAVVTDSEGDVVTDQFAVSTTNGSLVIKKAAVNDKGQLVDPETGQTITDPETGDPIVVVSVTVPNLDGEGSYVYDGTEHAPVVRDETTNRVLVSGNDYIVKYYPNGEGEGVRVVKDVGAYTIKVTFDSSSNFTGTLVSSVEITSRPVTLKSADATKIYDGTPLTANEQYNVEDISEGEDAGLVSGEDFVYSITGTQTVAGESDNTFTVTGVLWDTKLSNYTITTRFGTLTVKQAKVAQDPKNPGNMILVNDEGKPIDQDGNVLPEDADPVVMSTIKSDDNAETAPVYDGTDHKPVVKDNKTGDTLTEGTDYTITWYDENGNPIDPQSDGPINAGTKTAKITFRKDFGGEAEVTMIVNKRPVTFTGTDQETTYNGSKQSFDAWTDTTAGQEGKGLLGGDFGHKATLTYTAEGTKAGTHAEGTFTPKVSGVTDDTSKVEITAPAQVTIADKNGVDRTANYQITTTAGTLTITQKGVDEDGDGQPDPIPGTDPATPVIGVTGTDGDSAPTYDGQDHKPIVVDNSYVNPETGEREPKTLVEGTDYELTYYKAEDIDPETGKPKEGAEPITGDDAAKDAGDKVAVITFIGDFTGTLTAPVDVAPRKLTLTSADGEKDFDGTPLTKNAQTDVTVGGDGFVSGQGATYDITGSQTTAGSSENTFEYTLNEGTKASNYQIETKFGTLTVNPFSSDDNTGEPGSGKRIEVTPIAPDPAGGTNAQGGNTATYTGKPVERPVIVDSKTGETLEEGKDYKVTYYDENGNVVENPTNAGTYRVVVEFIGDYSGTYETTMTIDRAELRVSTPSASKTYDGSALTRSNGARLTGLVNGETATLRVIGSQTNPGSSRNGYRIVWDGTALEANYVVVSESLGTLTVTEAPAAPAQVSAQEPPADEPAADEPAAPATSNIAEPSNPLAPAEPTGPTEPVQGAWALLNLLAALVTAAFCAFRLGGIRRGEKARNTRRALRLATIVPAIVGIVAFVLTEDMSQPMVMTDAWTPLMVAILAAQAVMTVLARTKGATSDDQQATA